MRDRPEFPSMIPEESLIVNLNFIFSLQFAPHGLRDGAHALRQLGPGGDGELLGRVAHGDLRIRVHLHDQAVCSRRHTGQRQRCDIGGLARRVGGVDEDRQELRSRTTGTAAISSVLRVAVSKVRMPRSHSTTL